MSFANTQEKTNLVQFNPRSFYEPGMSHEMQDYSTDIFIPLHSKRATAIGDLIFAKCYSDGEEDSSRFFGLSKGQLSRNSVPPRASRAASQGGCEAGFSFALGTRLWTIVGREAPRRCLAA